MHQECLIALGANLPLDSQLPVETCQRALSKLVQSGVEVRRVSRFYRTPAFPAGAGPDYINAACAVRWHKCAADLMDILHSVEMAYARRRESRWASRTLDLDLLTYGHEISPDRATYDHWAGLPASEQANHTPDQLILPHPRIADRAFVLAPLADIAPDWRHPVTHFSVAQMLAALDPAEMREISPV